MKPPGLFVVCALAIAAPVAANPAAAPPPAPAPVGATAVVDRLVALVDGVPVWRSEVDAAIAPLLVSDPKAFRGEIEPKVIASMIDAIVVRKAAAAAFVEIPAGEVDAALDTIAAQNQLDRAGLDAAVVAHGYTVAGYRIEIATELRAEKTFRLWLMMHEPPPATADEIAATLAELKAGDPKLGSEVDPDKLKEMVYRNKEAAARETWVDQLRNSARIERR